MYVPVISRKSMERIRDAWITMYIPMVYKIAADRVAAAVAGVTRSRAGFVPVYFLYVQDEADIKLRSRADDGIEVVRRSRAS